MDEWDDSDLKEHVVRALLLKATTLRSASQLDDASAIYDALLKRLESVASEEGRRLRDLALVGKANNELAGGRWGAAMTSASMVVNGHKSVRPNAVVAAQTIVAQAAPEMKDSERAVHAIGELLDRLPEAGSISPGLVSALMMLSIQVGSESMRDMIRDSRSKGLLLPLTTALEQELGHTPRVAKEVEEVARDIRKELAERRKRRDEGSADPDAVSQEA